ncbi:PQ-loop repeat-containing protein [Aspergillus undulatus]|uniref:PQ-loop repeat-containing protein n=1 Tax=Aspergillus undulatus TaxID=1810928 RepID=UPI003CCCC185
MYIVSQLLEYGAPIFIVTSPVTSYADQILSIHRNRSSAGFSLDIPLIMLVASILKVFFWFGDYYNVALLAQAVLTIFVQVILLKVALDNRPAPGQRSGVEHIPFSGAQDKGFVRPYDFWQWRSTRPYWSFLAYFTGGLAFVHIFLTPISNSPTYISLLGYLGLAIEAVLPLPQVLANHRSRSCKGFRVSVVAAWVLGDVTKLSYFFTSEQPIPWAFRMCALFQFVCDSYLGVQFWMYGQGAPRPPLNPQQRLENEIGLEEKDIRMT